MTTLDPFQDVTILLVDDSELVRTGLKTLLTDRKATPAFEVVAEAANVAEAVQEGARTKPRVVLLDIRLPDGTGFEACRRILIDSPDSRVLILTSVIDDKMVYEAMSAGAHGYLLKEIDAAALFQAIIDVAAGKFILDPAVTTRFLNLIRNENSRPPIPKEESPLELLSAQERRVLALMAEGKTNKQIAEAMGLSDKTVKNYVSNMFEKLKINRRSQAAVLYSERRLQGLDVRRSS